jgi:hypothetical protein
MARSFAILEDLGAGLEEGLEEGLDEGMDAGLAVCATEDDPLVGLTTGELVCMCSSTSRASSAAASRAANSSAIESNS